MKTIAATALILTFATAALAAEPAREQTPEPRKAAAPIVLTATQLDGITAGTDRKSDGIDDIGLWVPYSENGPIVNRMGEFALYDE
jgi:hypothetical protein